MFTCAQFVNGHSISVLQLLSKYCIVRFMAFCTPWGLNAINPRGCSEPFRWYPVTCYTKFTICSNHKQNPSTASQQKTIVFVIVIRIWTTNLWMFREWRSWAKCIPICCLHSNYRNLGNLSWIQPGNDFTSKATSPF